MDNSPPPLKLTRTHWLICIIASIGFAFDIYELLMLPLIVKPALESLGNLQVGTPEYISWARTLFFVPALAGGVFGLLGGWLTDRLGRRRVLTWSILMYALGAFAAGFAQSLTTLLICRCAVFVGVCVEFVAAVAWLAELFPNKKQKEKVLGWTQAFSSLGGLMVAGVNVWCIKNAADLPAINGTHDAWRYTLISGLIPAIPLILIRPFMPESPVWQRKKEAGQLQRPRISELFAPALRGMTIKTTLLFACCYGVAFGAIQHLPQIVPGLADVKAAVTEAQAKADPAKANAVKAKVEQAAAAAVQTWQEVGGLVGRVLLAIMAVYFASRRRLLQVFVFPALVAIPALFWWISKNHATAGIMGQLHWWVFLAGMLLVSQFSFWGNYIPKAFPPHLRGTGESFAANIGGRLLGVSMAWMFFTFTSKGPASMAMTAAIIAGILLVISVVLSFFVEEPKHDE